MRYALFSDIHSNLTAFESVLADIASSKVDALICLGDVVGYNARPSECLNLVRKCKADLIMGNHDQYAAGDQDLAWFNPVARAGMEFSRDALSSADKKFLRKLPMIREYDGFTVVHATLNQPDEWDYVTHVEQAEEHFAHQKKPLCFIGHTHQVRVYRFDGKSVRTSATPDKLKLKDKFQYLVNVGSVGQPRDRNPAASYVIYDTKHQSVEFRRVRYPVQKAADEILNAGLPQYLAYRIMHGI